ncbi:centrosomal protein 20-like isoform X2 [Pongo pygmaeus]|uniref:centrosomal protein 20-like isoform X2 n=1 Tax=Pongo pygmaeus TaxID=9600 RepID=UPI00300D5CF4
MLPTERISLSPRLECSSAITAHCSFELRDSSDPPSSASRAVLKDTLEKKGVLGHLKARIRAEVFSALDDDREPRPSLSHENLLINELIREYLEFNKYKYTASVLIAESGQPVVPLDRQFLIHELNAFEESKDNTIPLLYGILAHFLHGTKDGIQNAFLKGPSLQPSDPSLGRQPSRRKPMDEHLRKEERKSTNIEELHVSQAVNR